MYRTSSVHSRDRTDAEGQARAAVVHLNFRAVSTFLVPVYTVASSMDRTSRCNKVGMVRLYALYSLNFLLLKGQICVQVERTQGSYSQDS